MLTCTFESLFPSLPSLLPPHSLFLTHTHTPTHTYLCTIAPNALSQICSFFPLTLICIQTPRLIYLPHPWRSTPRQTLALQGLIRCLSSMRSRGLLHSFKESLRHPIMFACLTVVSFTTDTMSFHLDFPSL